MTTGAPICSMQRRAKERENTVVMCGGNITGWKGGQSTYLHIKMEKDHITNLQKRKIKVFTIIIMLRYMDHDFNITIHYTYVKVGSNRGSSVNPVSRTGCSKVLIDKLQVCESAVTMLITTPHHTASNLNVGQADTA